MAIKPVCNKCKKELKKFGALYKAANRERMNFLKPKRKRRIYEVNS